MERFTRQGRNPRRQGNQLPGHSPSPPISLPVSPFQGSVVWGMSLPGAMLPLSGTGMLCALARGIGS
jgi:hypothetical protein